MATAGPSRSCIFGGPLNTNPHFHVLIPDGLFTPGPSEDDRARFVLLPPPTNEDIAHLNRDDHRALRPRLSVIRVSGRILHPIFSPLASRG